MRRYLLFFCISLLLCVGCRRVTVDFTYSPASPRSGEVVTFTNLSTNGEDYEWKFGDNHTATAKSTTHTFGKAGTYIVTLEETHSHQQCRHAVVVTDSLPAIAFSSDSICRYDSIWLYAQVWNPYDHSVTCQWSLDTYTQLLKGQLTDDSICVLFTRASDGLSEDVVVALTVRIDDTSYEVTKAVIVYEKPTWAVVLRTGSGDWYQTVYLPYYDEPISLSELSSAVRFDEAEARQALDDARTTLQVADPMEQKKYYGGANGLFVSHTNGANEVCITADSIGTLTIDRVHQRLFYSTQSGVYALPLIYAGSNQVADPPVRINNLNEVVAIVTME